MNDTTNGTSRDDDTITVHRDAVRFFAAMCFTAGCLFSILVLSIVAAVARA